jgi:hypothetical protein
MKTLTPENAQRIIDVACSTWKNTLFDQWGKQIVLKQEIRVSDSDYVKMREACTSAQNALFDEIFGKEEPQFKVGDWVTRTVEAYGVHFKGKTFLISAIDDDQVVENGTVNRHLKGSIRLATPEEIRLATTPKKGTACLCSINKDIWHVRYADGKGAFYLNGKKDGNTTDIFEYYHILPQELVDAING